MAAMHEGNDEPQLQREMSYASGNEKLDQDLKKMTGYVTMVHRKEKDGVNALEGRSLRERMARHAELREILKEPVLADDSDSSDEEYQRPAAPKISKIEQEMRDADKLKNQVELQALTQSILLEAKHRLVKQQNDPTLDEVYEFQNFDIATGIITLRRILDQHGIILKNLNANKAANFRKMHYDKFGDCWMLLDWQQEHDFRTKLRKGKGEHVIVIHYQILYGECCITEVGPSHIGQYWESIKMEYNIVNHPSTKKITNIENRTLGRVEFKVIEQDANAGHVQGSTAHIWTAIPKIGVPMVNILHFHINDMSDEIPIDQRWLTSDERDKLLNGNLDEIKLPEFKRDVNGVLLRYLILIFDQ